MRFPCVGRLRLHVEHGDRSGGDRPPEDLSGQGRRRRGGARRGPRCAHGRGLRLPRAERGGQVDDRADADDAADHHQRHRDGLRPRRRARAGRSAPQDRGGAPGGWPRRAPDRPRAADAAGTTVREQRGGGEGHRSAAARAGRARGRRGPRHQGLLRRDEAPARPGDGPRARAGGALPGRAHDRSGPGEPPHRLGRGPAHQRPRHDGVPHDAVPRGGRPALRPARHHRRRADRPRGNTVGPQGRPAQREGGDPTLDDVFLDATGRTRTKVAGEVAEVQA